VPVVDESDEKSPIFAIPVSGAPLGKWVMWGPCGAPVGLLKTLKTTSDSLETKAVIAPGTSGVFHGRSFKSLGGAGLPMWRSWEGG